MSERKKYIRQILESDLVKDLIEGLERGTSEDWDNCGKDIAAGIEALHNSAERPWTVLVPTQEAVDKYFQGHEDDAESSTKAMIGLNLDQCIRGTLLADGIDEALAAGNGEIELTTVGGCVVTARREGGKLVLIDPSGGRTTLIGPHIRSPVGAAFKVDNYLNGEMWAYHLRFGGAEDN